MKSPKIYTIDNRDYTIAKDLISDLSILPEASVFDLAYMQAIKFTGPAVAQFLQGQLTCDIHALHANNLLTGVLCNLQGRIICKVFCVMFMEEFYLLCPKDLTPSLLQSLKLSAQLSKISIAINNDLNIYGIYIKNLREIGSQYYPLDNDMYLVITDEKSPMKITHGSLAWHYHRIQYHDFEIYPCSQAIFLPHKLDLEKTNILSFTKGCYKGQEIIARMHYKSKKTHGLFKNIFHHNDTFTIGKPIVSHEILGILVDYCLTPEPNEYLGLFCKQI